jgi:hypothetical protein
VLDRAGLRWTSTTTRLFSKAQPRGPPHVRGREWNGDDEKQWLGRERDRYAREAVDGFLRAAQRRKRSNLDFLSRPFFLVTDGSLVTPSVQLIWDAVHRIFVRFGATTSRSFSPEAVPNQQPLREAAVA